MKLLRAETSRYWLPFRVPFRAGRGTLTTRSGLLLRVFGEGGLSGVGEASPAWWITGESLDRAAAALGDVAAAIRDRASAAAIRGRFLASGDLARRSPAAAAALDCALLDLAARAVAAPIARLFGGEPPAKLSLSTLLIGDSPEDVARDAEQKARAGFAALKLKIGSDGGDDALRVGAVRRGAGHAVELRLDANRAWTSEEAERLFDRIAIHEPAFVEEPLRDASVEAVAALRARSGIRIALDESLRDVATLAAHAAAHGADVVVLKAAAWGGITPAVAAGRRAYALGFEVVATDSIETSVGMAAALQIAASLSKTPRAVGLGGRALLDGDVVRDQDRLPDATSLPLPGPGLGVRLERERGHG